MSPAEASQSYLRWQQGDWAVVECPAHMSPAKALAEHPALAGYQPHPELPWAKGTSGLVLACRGRPQAAVAVAKWRVKVRVLASDGTLQKQETLRTSLGQWLRVQPEGKRRVLGDRGTYGSAAAHRPMRHLAALCVRGGEQDTWVEAAPCPELAYRSDRQPPVAQFGELLRQAWQKRRALWNPPHTEMVRWVHEHADGLPGVAVDRLGEFAVLQLSSAWALEHEASLAASLANAGCKGVYVKRRPKQANTIVDSRSEEYAPAEPICGAPAEDPVWLYENGLRYKMRLGDGLSTGLFLDQRRQRKWVHENSQGGHIVNLFAYTCGFSLAAALGGARRTDSVDISQGVLDWGRSNFEGHDLDTRRAHRFRAEGARVFLRRAKVKGQRFDGIVLDPPSFATTKRHRFRAMDHYGELVAECLWVLAKGGWLLASTNHRGISRRKFKQMVQEGAETAGVDIQLDADWGPGPDYPFLGSEPHLKSLLIRPAGRR